MRIHLQTLERKRRSLREENCHINSLNSISEDVEPLLSQLEQDIIKWSEPGDEEGERKVIGGAVFQFLTKNFAESKKHCEELCANVLELSMVQGKCRKAIQTRQPLEISAEIKAIADLYHKKVVGPAAREVLENNLSELNQLIDTVKMIPGSPQNIMLVGTGQDQIKLSWKPPAVNPEAAKMYIVWKRVVVEDEAWEEVIRTANFETMVYGLIPWNTYEFKVTATNPVTTSCASHCVKRHALL